MLPTRPTLRLHFMTTISVSQFSVAKFIVRRPLNMDPTLNIEIPFVLLGRKDVLDLNKIWPKEAPETRPLQELIDSLRKQCPDISVHIISYKEQATQDSSWHLFPSSLAIEDVLTIDEEGKLGKNVWTCPAVLSRQFIPLDTTSNAWRVFTSETTSIFTALNTLNNIHAPIKGIVGERGQVLKPRRWGIITPSQASLHITLTPSRPSSTLHHNLIKCVLVLNTALERELTFLTTPSALLKHWPMSRFMEYLAIRRLGKEKVELWRRLGERNWTEKRRAEVFAKEKRKWSGAGGEKNEDGEWWSVVEGMEVGELLEGIRGFNKGGRRLGIEPEFKQLDEEDEENDQGELEVTGVVSRGYRSTVDAVGIIAYTELIAGLTKLAHDYLEPGRLQQWLEVFRKSAHPVPEQPIQAFESLLSSLHTSDVTTSFFQSHFRIIYSKSPAGVHDQTRDNTNKPPSILIDPFRPLTHHISTARSKELAYMPIFISRYAKAGGFDTSSASKIYALMIADEDERQKHQDTKTRRTRGNEDWLGKVKGKVRVKDAVEVEVEDEEAPVNPEELNEEERIKLRTRIREGLYAQEDQ
jgi:hypothetical protein